MSLINFNQNRFPWVTNWLDTDDLFVDDLFSKKNNLPAMNVKENKSNFELELAVPGFSKKDIEVTMDQDVLCISGSNENTDEKEEEGYTRKEFSSASFERKIQLPQGVHPETEIKANYKNGVLKLELQKSQESIEQPKRTIAIH